MSRIVEETTAIKYAADNRTTESMADSSMLHSPRQAEVRGSSSHALFRHNEGQGLMSASNRDVCINPVHKNDALFNVLQWLKCSDTLPFARTVYWE